MDIISMSAAYTAGIIGNHPFVDSNKRTGFIIDILFLELNDYRFTASEEDAAQAVLALAAGTLNEEGFAMFLRLNTVLEGIKGELK
jgi:death-on-curing protein